jgi:hypothetical protein
MYLQQRTEILVGKKSECRRHQNFSQAVELSDCLELQAVIMGQGCHQDAKHTLPSLLPTTPD